ncbi:MAG: ABC transporter substrate-binding protein, partial [Dehalococcoidia bacterium]|nr:ABC transporter substrate-binding protein [Dehalococcoidia bacterium]
GDDPLTQVKSTPYIYRVSFSTSLATPPMGAWAYKKGYRKAVVIAGDYPAGWQHIGGFARTFTEAGGEIIQEIYTPLGSPDFAPYITSINRGADVVYAFESGSDALSFVTQYAEYGLNRQIPLLGRALTDEDVLQKEGDAALGIIMSTTFLPILDRPQMKTFVAAFGQKFGRPVTQYAEAGYIGAMALEAALQSTKGNIEDVDSFLKALSVVQVEGPSSPIKFDQYHNAVRNIYFIEAKKVEGKLVNAAIETLPQVSQFWTWTPEEFMKMPPYNDMKGKWAK